MYVTRGKTMALVTPYAITGKIFDVRNTSIIEGAIVTAWNKRTGETLKKTGTSNSSGNYIIDCANFNGDTPYVNGDSITVEATFSRTIGGKSVLTKRIQYRTTINTVNGFEDKDLTLRHLDPLSYVVDFLDEGWDLSTTDGIKPIIGKSLDIKELDHSNNDYVLMYSTDEGFVPFAIGGLTFHEKPMVTIDMRTTFKVNGLLDVSPHLSRMKREAYRLITAKVPLPSSDNQLIVPRRTKDLSDKSVGYGRMIIDIDVNFWGTR